MAKLREGHFSFDIFSGFRIFFYMFSTFSNLLGFLWIFWIFLLIYFVFFRFFSSSIIIIIIIFFFFFLRMFLDLFVFSFGFFSKLIRLLLKATEVTTEHQT